ATMNANFPSHTLGSITPAKEWSQDVQDEILGKAAGLTDTDTAAVAPHLDVTPSQPPLALHPAGHIPEDLTSTPAPTPISPINADAASITPVPALFEANPSSVPIAPPTLGYPTPPPLARGESTASTIMDIPGSWGEDKPSAPVQSVGPEGGDQIARDAKDALNNAANQAPGFLHRLQDTIDNLVGGTHNHTHDTVPPPNAGLLPAPGDNFTNTTATTSSHNDRDLAVGVVPAATLAAEHNEHDHQELSSPPIDGVPLGATRTNPDTTHIGNYSMTTLPNTDQGNSLNPQPTLLERAKQAVGGVQEAAVGAYNHPTTQSTIGSAQETLGSAMDAGNHYIEKGMAAIGLGAVVGYELEKHEESGDKEERHPIQTTTAGLPPAVPQATSPDSALEERLAAGGFKQHPIQTTTAGLPPA
ncbi:hypothetical protein FRB98_004581, partial [Tulasnella sp. 332]